MNPDKDKRISLFQERLVKLYLRSNGYFTTGFIVQAEDKGVETELDIVAIRFPYNEQTEREVKNSEYLQIPDTIDIIIGEVKMRTTALQFNKPIRSDGNRDENWKKLLKWVGLFDNNEVDILIPRLIDAVQTQEINKPDNFLIIDHPGRYGIVNIRPMFFAPDRPNPLPTTVRYISGSEIIQFIWNCLNPDAPRKYCVTDYSVDAWGEFTDIAGYFKKRHKEKQGICKMNDLYEEFVPDNAQQRIEKS